MALDTKDKRGSSIGVARPWSLILPTPDGAVNQGDRQQTAWSYRGISAIQGVLGPVYCFVGETYVPGAYFAETAIPGVYAGETHVPGTFAGEGG